MGDQPGSFDGAIYGLPLGRPVGETQGREPLEILASQFIDAIRAGAHPSVQEFSAGYPELGAEIDELFPLLAAMEEWKLFRERMSLDHRSLTILRNEKFGDFYVNREIGRGAMGIVFDAQERSSARHVAIKVLPFICTRDRHERFEREARTAGRLRHPHIVPVYSFGEHDGLCYYVMPLIRGWGLDRVISQLAGPKGIVLPEDILATFSAGSSAGGIEAPAAERSNWTKAASDAERAPGVRAFAGLSRNSWHAIATIGAQVADALHYAHQQGILHRDIKPANLLLDGNGAVWVTDFGLAQHSDEKGNLEQAGPAGTLRYVAPEQLEGRAGPGSDVYSLGVTLFELLTRNSPLAGLGDKSLREAIVKMPFPKPRDLNPRIPADLDAIVSKAIAKDAAQRYASAGELWTDLLRFLKGHRVQARGRFRWLRHRL